MSEKGNLEILYIAMIGKKEKRRVVLFELEESQLVGDQFAQQKKNEDDNTEVAKLKKKVTELETKISGNENDSSLEQKIYFLEKQMSSYAKYNEVMTIKLEQL